MLWKCQKALTTRQYPCVISLKCEQTSTVVVEIWEGVSMGCPVCWYLLDNLLAQCDCALIIGVCEG
jgi:hypothetical protein